MKPDRWRVHLVTCVLASMPLHAEATSPEGQMLSQDPQRFQTALGRKAARVSSALLELDTQSAIAANQCVMEPGRTMRAALQAQPLHDGERARDPPVCASAGQTRYRQNKVGKARWDYGVAQARIRSTHREAITACKQLPAGRQDPCKRAATLRTAHDKTTAQAAFHSATAQANARNVR